MRCDLPSQWNPLEISGNVTLSEHDCKVFGWFFAAASGTVTLPSPSRELNGVEIAVVNGTSGNEIVACPNGFPHNLDYVTINAGQSIFLTCGPAASGLYAWAVFGGTAA